MDWTHFWALLCLAALLVGAGLALYLASGAPGFLDWDGPPRTAGFLLFGAGVLSIGYAQSIYDYGMPATTLSGTVDLVSCSKGCVVRVRGEDGKTVDFKASASNLDLYAIEHSLVRVHSTPSSHEVVSIDYLLPDGRRGTVRCGKVMNLWMFAAGGLAMAAIVRKRKSDADLCPPMPIRPPGSAP